MPRSWFPEGAFTRLSSIHGESVGVYKIDGHQIKRILGECLLISSLLGKASRTLVDIARLAVSKPSLVNLISKDANLVFYLSVYPLLNTLQTSNYDVIFDFCVDSASLATSFKKCNVIMTPIKATCREIDSVYQATRNNAVNMRSN